MSQTSALYMVDESFLSGFPGSSAGKIHLWYRRPGLVPGLGRSPGKGTGFKSISKVFKATQKLPEKTIFASKM